MKKMMLKTITMLLLLSISSCSKDDDKPAQAENSNIFEAVVDGVQYKPPFVTGFRNTNLDVIIISGETGSNEERIQFFFPQDITPGLYTISNGISNVNIQGYYSPPNSQEANDDGFINSATIVISEHNLSTKVIRGTFSFVTKAAINSEIVWDVDEGVFSITYSDI